MTPEQRKIAEDIQSLFQKVQSAQPASDPFLETRLMARSRERQGRKFLFWKRLAIGTSAMTFVLVAALAFFLLRSSYPEAYVNEPFAVRLEVKDLRHLSIAKAQIQLSDGVDFDRDQFPELRGVNEVTLVWKNQNETHFVPMLLRAAEPGLKSVTVRFFDEAGTLVAERKLDVKLKRFGSKT